MKGDILGGTEVPIAGGSNIFAPIRVRYECTTVHILRRMEGWEGTVLKGTYERKGRLYEGGYFRRN